MEKTILLHIARARSLVLAATLILASSSFVQAQLRFGSSVTAARVVYPLIRVDPADGQDTLVEISNLSSQPIEADCFYGTFARICGSNGTICTSPKDCLPGGFCAPPQFIDVNFSVRLIGRQPLQWRASAGLAGSDLPLPNGFCSALPLPCKDDEDCQFQGGSCSASNFGTRVPPVLFDPFIGYLVCSARNADGTASDRNDLRGSATLLRLDEEEAGADDAAQYRAIGIPAVTTQINGTPQVRYAECPNSIAFQHYFDGTLEPTAMQTDIFTTLALIRCDNNFRSTEFTLLHGQNVNEFLNKTGVDASVSFYSPHVVTRLDQSLFQTTTTGLTSFSFPAAAVMIEEHVDPNDVLPSRSAAWEPIYDRDVALTSATATPAPTGPVPTLTPTPTPSSFGPEITHFGLAGASGRVLPAGVSDLGFPLYEVPRGLGFVFVLEVRRGASGSSPLNLSSEDSLQIQSNRPLGDGSPEVCDSGGVPGVSPTSFDTEVPEIRDAFDDFRCRFRELRNPPFCTMNTAGLPEMVSPLSQSQACSTAVIGRDLELPAGDTVLTARWSDVFGHFGAEKRIVVRVGD